VIRPRRVGIALLLAFVVAGCGSTTTTPSPSALAAVEPSATASASPGPTLTAPTAKPAATATPEPTPTASPTPAPTPTPWKSYTSKRYHYKMKYPPGWIVTPGSAKFADQFDSYGYPYVYVSRDVVSSGSTASISLTASHDIAYYKSHFKAKVLVNKNITVAGWPARLLIFSGVDNGVKMYFQRLNVARGRVGYFITMDGLYQDAKADKTLFRKIYLTFKPRP
jgi:hypothetical protein